MTHELKQVTTPEDWAAMHAIRRAVLFTQERHPGIVYDENHPHDHAADHVPYLLLFEGQPIGCVRLDFEGEFATVRLVGIVEQLQRQGHGAALEQLVSDLARGLGARKLGLNSAPSAIGFYEKCGWTRETWDASELIGMASDCVQMVKPL